MTRTNSYKSVEDLLKKEHDQILKALANLRRDDPFADLNRTGDNASADTDAYEDSEHQRIEVQENELRERIGHIENALAKIKNGTYGICVTCGQDIQPERLNANPIAFVCITCEQKKSQS